MSKPSRRRKKFFIFRGDERPGEDYVVLKSTMNLYAAGEGADARSAEAELRQKVSGCGGNAVFNYQCNIGKRGPYTVYTAWGNPALIVPAAERDEAEEKKLLAGYVEDLYAAEDKARRVSAWRSKCLKALPAVVIIACLVILLFNR